jgi:hypothetical protein
VDQIQSYPVHREAAQIALLLRFLPVGIEMEIEVVELLGYYTGVIYARGWCEIYMNEEVMFIPDGETFMIYSQLPASLMIHHIDMIEARVFIYILENLFNLNR